MIQVLKKKFVITAMAAISILLVLLLGGINIVNAWSTAKEEETLLRVLLDNEIRQIPMAEKPPIEEKSPMRGRNLFSPPLTEDDKRSAVFFTVRFDTAGVVSQTDVSHIASIGEDEAKTLAQDVSAEGKTEGKTGYFRYGSVETPDGRGRVYIFMDISSEYASVLRVGLLSVLAGFACWVLMLLLVIFLSERAIRPIAENIQRQKQFVTDAGHEIKTPLAIILANTEALELHNGQSKWSRNIREQITRLTGLMQNLLTLAKYDESEGKAGMTTVSLSDSVTDTIRIFGEAVELKNLKLDTQIAPEVTVKGNKEQISQMLSILMDNAVKYSPDGGSIRLSLQKTGKTVVLEIENTCEELPSCEPDKLFDRFYRADAARTQKSGGYGIGLSAAQAIVRIHHGTISARYEQQNRIIFTVKFS